MDDLSRNCGAVEADVWLDDGQRVLVGPTEASLDVNRTLSSLYIEPMVQALELRHGSHHALKRPPTPNADLVAETIDEGPNMRKSSTYVRTYPQTLPAESTILHTAPSAVLCRSRS